MPETMFWFGISASLALLIRALVERSQALVWLAIGLLVPCALITASGASAVAVWLIVATQALMIRAIFNRSWMAMWLAACGSYAFSILSMFSIGAFVFVLTCIQLPMAVALRSGAGAWRVATAGLAGILIWVLVVPVQVWWIEWLGGFGMYQIVGLGGLLLALLPTTIIQGGSKPVKTIGLAP